MRRLALTAASALILLTAAACGSDDDAGSADDPTSAPTTEATPDSTPDPTSAATEETGTTSAGADPDAAGELPSYDEVKALWLASTSEGDRASCESGDTEDKSIGSSGDGEYLRFVCNGITRFDYVVGADNYADNFAAASADLTGRAVFHLPGEAYVKPAGANVDLAPAIRDACGCGEVVGPS